MLFIYLGYTILDKRSTVYKFDSQVFTPYKFWWHSREMNPRPFQLEGRHANHWTTALLQLQLLDI